MLRAIYHPLHPPLEKGAPRPPLDRRGVTSPVGAHVRKPVTLRRSGMFSLSALQLVRIPLLPMVKSNGCFQDKVKLGCLERHGWEKERSVSCFLAPRLRQICYAASPPSRLSVYYASNMQQPSEVSNAVTAPSKQKHRGQPPGVSLVSWRDCGSPRACHVRVIESESIYLHGTRCSTQYFRHL